MIYINIKKMDFYKNFDWTAKGNKILVRSLEPNLYKLSELYNSLEEIDGLVIQQKTIGGIRYVEIYDKEKLLFFVKKSKKEIKKRFFVVDHTQSEWYIGCRISTEGDLSQYLERVDWWYSKASNDEIWRTAFVRLYGEIDFRKIWENLRRWVCLDKKNRRTDLNKTFHHFVKNSLR